MLDKAVKKLMESGEVTPHDLQVALEEQLRTNKNLTLILIEKGLTTEARIKDILESYDLEDIDIKDIYIHPNVIKMLPEHIIKNNKVFPLKFENNALILAMVNVKDLLTKDSVSMVLGKSTALQTCAISKEEHEYLIKKFLKTGAEKVESNELSITQKDVSDVNSESSINRLIGKMIESAIKKFAGQISIEPALEDVRIRFKIDDAFYEEARLSKKIYTQFINQIRQAFAIDPAKKHNFSGNYRFFDSNKREFNILLDSLNTINGEKLILRIGYPIPDIEKLFYTDKAYLEIYKSIEKNKGLVLVVGDSGSGKTTTLYSILKSKISNKHQLMTIEENIQYIFDTYVSQTKLDKNTSLKELVYDMIKHNPNVIMFEESKDPSWALLIEELALSGMLVLTSFRSYNVVSALKRMKALGFPNFSSIQSIINQKLLKCLCDNCKIRVESSDELKKALALSDDAFITPYEPDIRGCNYCLGGYKGMIATFEIVRVNKELVDLINKDDFTEVAKKFNSFCITTFKEHAKHLFADGIIPLSVLKEV
ncbi:MAG: ATPase, T2SS/T4P/T4SS family [Candidatus Sericytochromatia bacterium]